MNDLIKEIQAALVAATPTELVLLKDQRLFNNKPAHHVATIGKEATESDKLLLIEHKVWLQQLITMLQQCDEALSELDALFDFSQPLKDDELVRFDDVAGTNAAFEKCYRLINPEQAAVNEALKAGEPHE